jgi:hypothetical protein
MYRKTKLQRRIMTKYMRNTRKVHLALDKDNNIISASLTPQKKGATVNGLIHKVKTTVLEHGWQCIRITEEDIEQIAAEIEKEALDNDGAVEVCQIFPIVMNSYQMPEGATIIFDRNKFSDCIASIIEAHDIQYGVSLKTIRYELLSDDYYKVNKQC